MGKEAEIMGEQGCRCSAGVCVFISRRRLSDDIIPHILNLLKQIKSAFYSFSKVFSESRIMEYSIKEKLTSPGKAEDYKFMGKNIDVISLIKLYVVDGKVVRHEDWWDKKPVWNKETVKLLLIGRIIEITRRGSLLATHAMMGFGKDRTM